MWQGCAQSVELYRSWSLWSLREGVYLAVLDTHTVEPNRPCFLVSSSDLESCAQRPVFDVLWGNVVVTGHIHISPPCHFLSLDML